MFDLLQKKGIACLLLAAVVCAGCDSGPQMAPVEGRVTLDGEPLKFGTVMFQHEKGGQPAKGEIQPDGSFVLSTFRPEDGAVVGNQKVRISCFSSEDPAIKAQGGPQGDSLGQLLIPQKYAAFGTSGLRVEVKPDGNEPFAFELESGKKRRRR